MIKFQQRRPNDPPAAIVNLAGICDAQLGVTKTICLFSGFNHKEKTMIFASLIFLLLSYEVFPDGHFVTYDPPLSCSHKSRPAYCGYPKVKLETLLNVEDFDNCAPSLLPLDARNYYYGTPGRAVTYERNLAAYDKAIITPYLLRNVSHVDISTTVLGEKIAFPVGLSPTAAHKLAYPTGELATAKGMGNMGTVMILSSLSNTRLEDVFAEAHRANKPGTLPPVMWMQTYVLRNRQETLSYVWRAEKTGYKALVMTVDSPFLPSGNCKNRDLLSSGRLKYPNFFNETFTSDKLDPSLTFQDITWLKKHTNLPIVCKGILSGHDAVKAVQAGASAILMSNHGGRQLDSASSTFDALPGVVEALKNTYPHVEVYLDGGIRNGYSVFKALDRGARAVFVGRPQLWGLAVAGDKGVRKVLEILKSEFNETMVLAGRRTTAEVGPDFKP